MPLKLNNLGMYLFPLNNKDIDGLQGKIEFSLQSITFCIWLEQIFR